jgi:hypothetical protein
MLRVQTQAMGHWRARRHGHHHAGDGQQEQRQKSPFVDGPPPAADDGIIGSG